jgi:hypothetical protein
LIMRDEYRKSAAGGQAMVTPLRRTSLFGSAV